MYFMASTVNFLFFFPEYSKYQSTHYCKISCTVYWFRRDGTSAATTTNKLPVKKANDCTGNSSCYIQPISVQPIFHVHNAKSEYFINSLQVREPQLFFYVRQSADATWHSTNQPGPTGFHAYRFQLFHRVPKHKYDRHA